jgi:nitrogen fixation protein NifU and related proteins
MQFDDLHREIIQEHYRNPRHKTALSEEEREAVLDNPSCGDRVALRIIMEGDRIDEIAFDGEGCSISMASASILTELLSGKTLEEAKETTMRIHQIFRGEVPPETLEEYGDIAAFQGLLQYPVRLKCATLAWQTMDLLLEKQQS